MTTYDRRSVLRTAFILGGASVASFASACATGTPTSARTPAVPTSSPASTPGSVEGRPRVLLVYFSRPGENYYYGDRTILDVGNTQVVAETIKSLIDVDEYVIEATEPYSRNYDATVERNRREQQDDARPVIANPLPDVTGYDTVLLGSPVWNTRAPMIMWTFVEGVELAGMTIHPFVTHAVSGMGTVAEDYARICPDSTVSRGLAVQGEEATEATSLVAAWLQEIELDGAGGAAHR
ncbi:flavodoxin [Isoptericola sp. NPDC056578]|uniref:flavodoxin n=1 Tax=Isoptericola sp. NPDC056578 TaxID=3345870 RepID=UPI0036800545